MAHDDDDDHNDDDDSVLNEFQDLEQIADEFKRHVNVDDRTYRLKTYRQVFVGSDAVDYLVESGHVATRDDAVLLGRALQQMHVFEHVLRDHDFKDEYLFYKFVDKNERGSYKIDDRTGRAIKWSNLFGGDGSDRDDGPDSISLLPNLPQPDFVDKLNPKDVHVASSVWPLDEYNTALLDNVHPPDWQDPQQKSESYAKASSNSKDAEENNPLYQYDLVVIGAGVGGLITAAGSAGVGAKVAMIEANLLGGDCLNVGCVPSKAIIHSANMAHRVRGDVDRLERAGIFIDPMSVKVDFEKVMERVRRVRADISHHDSAERYSRELGVDVWIGYAKFNSKQSVVVNGKTLKFKRAVIATGGYPALIPMDGLKELHAKSATAPSWSTTTTTSNSSHNEHGPRPLVMTNETFFNMTKQPKHLVVIGAGVIGMELAQAMQRLGTQVTVMGRSGKVLPKEDVDMADVVKQQLIKDGVKFRLSVAKYCSVTLTGNVFEDNGYPEMALTVEEKSANVDSESLGTAPAATGPSTGPLPTTTVIACDAILVAAGRRPNVTGMDLELANVEFDTIKGLIVNDKLQTSNPRIYGVGDCCSEFKFTHAADFMARTVIRNALFFGRGKMSDLLIPYATFTSPEIASVGLYGKDLTENGIEYRVIEKHFKDNDRAICDDNTTGFVRFRVDAKKDTILGCSIVGENAGNMIGEVAVAMTTQTGLGSLAYVIHPYPTTSEAIRQSGDVYNKTKLTTTVKSLLRGIVKIQK